MMHQRPCRTHARSVVVSTLLTVAGLLLVTQWWLEPSLDDERDKLYSQRRERLTQRYDAMSAESHNRGEAAPELVVMLGSSRTFNAIDGKTAESVLRARFGRDVCFAGFGTPGASPYNQMVLLGRLLRDGIEPDLLLIEVHPAMLDDDMPRFSLATPITARDQSWIEQHDLPVEEPAPKQSWALAAYRTPILRRVAPKLLPRDDQPAQALVTSDEWGGYLHPPLTEPDRQEKAFEVARQQYAEVLGNFEVSPTRLRILKSLLDECRRRDIPTTLVVLPEGSRFRTWYPPGRMEQLEQTLATLAHDTHANLVAHYWRWDDDSDFLDSHHMIDKGASRLTTQLFREAVAPELETVIAAKEQGSIRR